jgi:hypothetical protein
MNFIISENQLKYLLEVVTNEEVICGKCGWSWELSDGGDDPYICHKCGYDNGKKEFIGEKVMVYYNLHKHTFSVKHKNKLIVYADYVKLGDVEFRVRQGGKEKVRSEKQKNVHAFVIGDLLDYCAYPCDDIPKPPSNGVVTYNPYKYDSFIYKENKEPVFFAEEVVMINSTNKIFVVKE